MKKHSLIWQFVSFFTTQKIYLPKNETSPTKFLAFGVLSSKSLFLELCSVIYYPYYKDFLEQ